jgi:hypothetical protein
MATRLSKNGRTLLRDVSKGGPRWLKICAPIVVFWALMMYLVTRPVSNNSVNSVPAAANYVQSQGAPPSSPSQQNVFQSPYITVATPISTPWPTDTPTPDSTVTPAPGLTITPAPEATVTPTTQPSHGLVYNQTSGFAPNQKTQQTGFVYPTNFNSGYQGGSQK